MGMSKEEFMSRYMADRTKKQKKIKGDVLGYFSERRTRYLRQKQKWNRYKVK